MRPLFSIITPTYNAESTIGRTLRSVQQQTCALYEHIVVDGKSSDTTMALVEACDNPLLTYSSEKDRGIYDAMNKGISRAKGDYLIFLNSGDAFHSPDTLQHYADKILANDYPGIVYGQTVLTDIDGNVLGPRHLQAPEELTLKSFADGMLVCHQAMAVYRGIAMLYNTRYKYSADYEWAIICLQHSRRNVYLPEVTIDYLAEGMTTKHHRESLKERFKIMCTYYGTLPTVLRHIRFALRYMLRRKSAANAQ